MTVFLEVENLVDFPLNYSVPIGSLLFPQTWLINIGCLPSWEIAFPFSTPAMC